MLRLDKLTIKAQETFQEAQEVAARHDQQQIEPLREVDVRFQGS